MWILFGTNRYTLEDYEHVYFIGIFDTIELADKHKKLLYQHGNYRNYFL